MLTRMADSAYVATPASEEDAGRCLPEEALQEFFRDRRDFPPLNAMRRFVHGGLLPNRSERSGNSNGVVRVVLLRFEAAFFRRRTDN